MKTINCNLGCSFSADADAINKILTNPKNKCEVISSISNNPVSILEYCFEYMLSNIFDEVYDPSLHHYQPEAMHRKFMHKAFEFNLEYICQFVDKEIILELLNKYYEILLAQKIEHSYIYNNSINQ
jgi:hypothetical protein